MTVKVINRALRDYLNSMVSELEDRGLCMKCAQDAHLPGAHKAQPLEASRNARL